MTLAQNGLKHCKMVWKNQDPTFPEVKKSQSLWGQMHQIM